MLRTRILTVLVVLPLFLGALFLLPVVGWALFMLAVSLIATWEWGRITRLPPLATAGCGALVLVLAALWWHIGTRAWVELVALVVSVAFWVVAAPVWLGRLAHVTSTPIRVVTGLIVVFPTWLALVVLRQAFGPWAVLEVAAVLWVSDSAAYFAGRRFGRHKLAPAVSPGKTWEGVAGALVAVALYALALIQWGTPGSSAPGTGGSAFAGQLGAWSMPAFLVLAVLGIEGDLFESWMKRGAGLKDSGSILPGHGGVLDRIDALTAALPAAALMLAAGIRWGWKVAS